MARPHGDCTVVVYIGVISNYWLVNFSFCRDIGSFWRNVRKRMGQFMGK